MPSRRPISGNEASSHWRSLSTSLLYTAVRYGLGVDWVLSGPREDIDALTFTRTSDGGYGLVNLTAQWRLAPQWTLQGRIENALDKHYVLADGFNTEERAWFIELRFKGGD